MKHKDEEKQQFEIAGNLHLQIWMECILDWRPECTLDFTASYFHSRPVSQHSS